MFVIKKICIRILTNTYFICMETLYDCKYDYFIAKYRPSYFLKRERERGMHFQVCKAIHLSSVTLVCTSGCANAKY